MYLIYMLVCMICTGLYCYALVYMLGQRFSAALLPQLFGTNPRSHHKGATGRVWTGDQLLPVLCHCQLGQDIPVYVLYVMYSYVLACICMLVTVCFKLLSFSIAICGGTALIAHICRYFVCIGLYCLYSSVLHIWYVLVCMLYAGIYGMYWYVLLCIVV